MAKTQQIMWTALPNGLTNDGKAYRVSVLVSPRLSHSSAKPILLKEFPDFGDWPQVLARATFSFDYGAQHVAELRLVSAPVSADWIAVFPPDTPVRSYAFEDRRDDTVLSYPVGEIHDFVRDTYADLVGEAGNELPKRTQLVNRFRQLLEPLARPDAVLRKLRAAQKTPGGKRQGKDLRGAFELLQTYHRPLAAETPGQYKKKDSNDPREDTQEWELYKVVDLPEEDEFKDLIDFHRIVSSVNQYRGFLRRLGLVLDFEIPIGDMPDASMVDKLHVRAHWPVVSKSVSGVDTQPDSAPATMTRIEPKQNLEAVLFDATTPIAGGFLRFNEKFQLIQVDVDGAGLKIKNLARSLVTMRGADKSAEEPRAGVPALRSAGIMLVEHDRGQKLKDALGRSGDHKAAEAAGATELYREDLIRGYHVDIFDADTGKWQSLCRRDGRIDLLNVIDTVPVNDEEGAVRLGATQAADGNNPDIVKLYEGLFAWTGWSLTAPAPGKAIDTEQDSKGKDVVGTMSNRAPDGLPFEVHFAPRGKSLPSLRYGRQYRMRVRVVDLAHNAAGLGATEPKDAASAPENYLRYEPVEPPALALIRSDAIEAPGDGESMGRLAIRTFNEQPPDNVVTATEVARRYVAAPRTSAKQAETHSMIDKGKRIDPASFSLLSTRDAPLRSVSLSFDGVPHEYSIAEDGFSLPYLPDPLANQVALQFLGPANVGVTTLMPIPYYPAGAWPDALPFKIKIFEKPGAKPVFRESTRTLEVPLAKADIVTLRLSHTLRPDNLEQMGVWQWFKQKYGESAEVLRRALEGGNWLLSPWLDIELVHAVQKPLVRPAFENLSASRSHGETHAHLLSSTPIDSHSTDKVDVLGRWNEPDDNLAENEPRSINRRGHAFERKLDYKGAAGVTPPGRIHFRSERHEFGDTRYRRVQYRIEATSRFREFMPPDIRNAGSDTKTNSRIKVISDESVAWVPNGSSPPAPDVLYVVPTFGWTRRTLAGTTRSWRDGGGLRIYLNRPWFVTGFNEMLAVVLPPDNATKDQIGGILKPFVTQWGTDPIWGGTNIKTASPALSRFPLAVTAGPLDPAKLPAFAPPEEADLPHAPFPLTNLVNPTLPEDSPVRLNAVPHAVQYDPERKLWFCDVVIDPGAAYFPFVRLALSRYHPVSSPRSHLSPVVTTEFVQLTPDRLAVVTPASKSSIAVALYGHAYTKGPLSRVQKPVVQIDVERFNPELGEDFGWERVAGAKVALKAAAATPARRRPSVRKSRTVGRAANARVSVAAAVMAKAEKLLAARDFAGILADRNVFAFLQPPVIWEGTVTLPAAARSRRLRIMIKEYERHQVDEDHVDIVRGQPDPRLRLVYAEAIEF